MFARNRRRRGQRNANTYSRAVTTRSNNYHHRRYWLCNTGSGGSDDDEEREGFAKEQRRSRLFKALMCTLYGHLDEDSQPNSSPLRKWEALSELRNIMSLYTSLTKRAPPLSVPGNQLFKDFVMYSAAYLSYKWQIEDSNIVSQILINIFRNCGNFMILFQKTLPHPTKDFGWIGPLALMNNGSNRAATARTQVQRYCPFSFFASHANRAHATYRWVRFIDLRLMHPNGFRPSPVYLSATHGQLELLRFLLQLGADLGDNYQPKLPRYQLPHQFYSNKNNMPWIYTVFDKLLSSALRSGVLTPSDPTDNEDRPDQGRTDIRCMRILLRAVPHINIEWLEFRRNSFWKTIYPTAKQMVISMSDNGLLPTFAQRCLQPAELKHLCRITLRKRLRENWKLPEGIYQLQLPRILESYLNLEED